MKIIKVIFLIVVPLVALTFMALDYQILFPDALVNSLVVVMDAEKIVWKCNCKFCTLDYYLCMVRHSNRNNRIYCLGHLQNTHGQESLPVTHLEHGSIMLT